MRCSGKLIGILSLCAMVSCTRPLAPSLQGDATLTVRVNTGTLATRAVTPGDENVSDGGGIYLTSGIPDLQLLVFDAEGTRVRSYPGDYARLSADLPITATGMSVTFTALPAGTYQVYAFANSGGLWDMENDSGEVTLATLRSIAERRNVENLRFMPLAADTPLSLLNDRVPLSATGSVTVSSGGNGNVSLEMIRCVAKVSLEFKNFTGAPLTLGDFSFTLSGLNPDRAYVLPVPLPQLPLGIRYGRIQKQFEQPVTYDVDGGGTYSWYVFPSVADPLYTLSASFRVNGGETPLYYNNLPVHDDHAVNIPSLERNQHLHIVTRIAADLDISFNFEVAGWEQKEENVTFD